MWARRAAVFFASLCAALVAAELVQLYRLRGGAIGTQEALDDPRVRRSVVAELLSSNPGLFDSHPDAAVARVLAPGLTDEPMGDIRVSANAWGMRERPYQLPRPPGVTRVALLGDSYVFGNGIEADERFGTFLERELRERASASFAGEIECLHLGISSWNIIAECTFARRQLSDLDPDLLVQVIVSNDLDDNSGVRGFGVLADFDPRLARRTNSRVYKGYAVDLLGAKQGSFLNHGLDQESRGRYAEATRQILALAQAVERDARRHYLLVSCLGDVGNTNLLEFLGGGLRDDQLLFVGHELLEEERYRVSATDPHWNRSGQERLARFLFGAIQTRALLPGVDPAPWPEATAELEQHAEVRRELAAFTPRGPRIAARLEDPRQIYGGIDAASLVSPYASLVLAPSGGSELHVVARCLERPELDGATVEIFVEDRPVGTFELRAGTTVDRSWPLPDELARRDYVNVRFVSDDWAYVGNERRDCKSFRLDAVEVR